MGLRIGVIGTGPHGLLLINTLDELKADIVSVYGHQNRVQIPLMPFAETTGEVVDRSDAVIISIPPDQTCELLMSIIPTGKPIFCEKPMVASIEEAEVIKNAVAEYGTKFMVGHPFCYADNIQEIIGQTWDFGVATLKRPRPGKQMNPYWNLGVHYVSVLDLLNVKDYGVELLFDQRYAGCEDAVFSLWDNERTRFTWRPEGEIWRNEILAFMKYAETGEGCITDVKHGCRVIRELYTRYGPIDYNI